MWFAWLWNWLFPDRRDVAEIARQESLRRIYEDTKPILCSYQGPKRDPTTPHLLKEMFNRLNIEEYHYLCPDSCYISLHCVVANHQVLIYFDEPSEEELKKFLLDGYTIIHDPLRLELHLKNIATSTEVYLTDTSKI